MKIDPKDWWAVSVAAFVVGFIVGGEFVRSTQRRQEAPVAEHSIPGAQWIGTVYSPPSMAEIAGE